MESVLVLGIIVLCFYLYTTLSGEKESKKYVEEKRQEQLEEFAKDKSALDFHIKCKQISNVLIREFPGSSLKKQQHFKIGNDYISAYKFGAYGYIYDEIRLSTDWSYDVKKKEINLELTIRKYLKVEPYTSHIVKPSIDKKELLNYEFDLNPEIIVKDIKIYIDRFLRENKNKI